MMATKTDMVPTFLKLTFTNRDLLSTSSSLALIFSFIQRGSVIPFLQGSYED